MKPPNSTVDLLLSLLAQHQNVVAGVVAALTVMLVLRIAIRDSQRQRDQTGSQQQAPKHNRVTSLPEVAVPKELASESTPLQAKDSGEGILLPSPPKSVSVPPPSEDRSEAAEVYVWR